MPGGYPASTAASTSPLIAAHHGASETVTDGEVGPIAAACCGVPGCRHWLTAGVDLGQHVSRSGAVSETLLGGEEHAGDDGAMSRSLFDLVVPVERTSRPFRDFRDSLAFTAARRLMDEVFAGFRDVDGSFVREFQTAGISPRVFELALFAYLREQGYDLDRTSPMPDFIIRGEPQVAIEACTSNPSQAADDDDAGLPASGWPSLPDDLQSEEREFVFQAGKALRRKLLKRDAAGRAYWELPHLAGAPFVIALQSFHNPSALFHSVGFLAQYLYGRRDIATYDSNGRLHLEAEPIDQHHHAGKSIPSGLFALPEAANLAAVLFSNSSTVSMFNRIGTQRGYGPPDIAMIRIGTIVDPDPNATQPRLFGQLIGPVEPDQRETFGEGLHVLHNPWADTRLPVGTLRGVTEHRLLDDGRLLTTATRLGPFTSQTLIFEGVGAEAHAQVQLARFLGLITDDASN